MSRTLEQIKQEYWYALRHSKITVKNVMDLKFITQGPEVGKETEFFTEERLAKVKEIMASAGYK